MKIYCLYGVGLPTERSYYYTRANDDISKPSMDCDIDVSALLNGTDIKEEEFMNAVVQKNIEQSGQSDKHNDEENMPQAPPIVGTLVNPSNFVLTCFFFI